MGQATGKSTARVPNLQGQPAAANRPQWPGCLPALPDRIRSPDMKWTDQSPDISAVVPGERIEFSVARTLCGHTEAKRPVVVTTSDVHARVLAHLRESDDEQGGLLIGVPYQQPDNAGQSGTPDVISIVCAVPAVQSSGTGYSLRMEAAVWADANRQMATISLHGKRIVGWYHSHPGLGAFFSSTDMKTQRAFFPHFYSVGWVIDPSDDSHAMFVGPGSQAISAAIVSDALTSVGT